MDTWARVLSVRAFPQRVAGTRHYPPQSYYYALLLELGYRSWRGGDNK